MTAEFAEPGAQQNGQIVGAASVHARQLVAAGRARQIHVPLVLRHVIGEEQVDLMAFPDGDPGFTGLESPHMPAAGPLRGLSGRCNRAR